MLRRVLRFLTGRFVRTLAIAFALALVWQVWWLWPPQPEVRYQWPSPGLDWFGSVTADGQIFFLGHVVRQVDDSAPRFDVDIIDLVTGSRVTTIHDLKGDLSVSPDGSRAVCQGPPGVWQLWNLRGAKQVAAIRADVRSQAEWSPDGRYLAIAGSELVVVYQCDPMQEVIRTGTDGHQLFMIPDGSGMIVPSEDGGRIDVWSFAPPRIVDSLELPYPPADRDELWTNAGPEPGSMFIRTLAANRDGSVVVTLLHRYQPRENGLAATTYVEVWHRETRQCREINLGGAGNLVASHSVIMDPHGRYFVHNRMFPVGDLILPDWVRGDTDDINHGVLWDLSVTPPLCRDASLVPAAHNLRFDRTGTRLISRERGITAIHDAASLRPLAKFDELPYYQLESMMNRDWMAIPTKFKLPDWLPNVAADILKGIYHTPQMSLLTVRLTDGSIGRSIPGREFQRFSSDGQLWTCSSSERSDGGQTPPVILERWSPESPIPWWLWLVTALGGVLVMRSLGFLRRGRMNLERTAA